MTLGYLNLVLHAHLPYVRHPEREDRIEERWLFEALTETYIPLLQVFHGLLDDGVDFRVTMSLSPPLISMLADELLQTRYRRHMANLLALCESEQTRTADDPARRSLAKEYQRRFEQVVQFFEDYSGNILPAFAQLHQAGKLELITSAATHAFLPYLRTQAAIEAQIATAVDCFITHLGFRPKGIWLPECAYDARVEASLQRHGIRYFFTDTHGLTSATPAPVFGTFAPVVTPSGLAAFARDEESSRQVWSSTEGYPGDYDYREYYRDIGFDLPEQDLQPFAHKEGIRLNTGIKYYRITGQTGEKALYDFHLAREKAATHAGNFLFNRTQQVAYAKSRMGRLPVVTAPYDAELFGHWWYEGPIFLDMLFRKMHYDQTEIKSITPSEYLDMYGDFQLATLDFSTWGRGGYGDVWLQGDNDWIYPALHDCELQMTRLADAYVHPSSLVRRALNQAARELMLAESSDFAFIMDSKTTVDYAVERTKQHVNRFRHLCSMLDQRDIDVSYVSDAEALSPIFPNLDYRCFQSNPQHAADLPDRDVVRVLLLSWEFPPMTVGGLARHVYDLSRHLVEQGCEVHVVTTAVDGYPLDEIVEGVHVHRVRVAQPDGGEFIHFVLQLNLAMLARCRQMIEVEGYQFNVIHAHDWLVGEVACLLKQHYGIPLIATIHATEHGRNHGISTDVQRHIHHIEWRLTYEASEVIVCSTYMLHELMDVFALPGEKVHVIPNGVDRRLLESAKGHRTPDDVCEERPIILFIGRLVREKGVHVLLDAASDILQDVPDARVVILGQGPMQQALRDQSERLGLGHCVEFWGFVDDDTRNDLFHRARVAVFPSLYEPFGIVALEAMAAGVPVVVSDVGGLCDIVRHEHNGLKAYAGDAASLSCQIKRLLFDPNLSHSLSTVAEQELSRFDWRRIAEHTIQVYGCVVVKASTVEAPTA
ncbi:1,4-alpha-glucan branching protein domain-containing protein [Alicyclobacillus fastidiosus]|uniref:DUF1957 domain-containing protein n=1 Tax=Alicyclobacillus fastidiosus TaxID=392011 RepID=A0ABV5AFC8_9BACL|nr:1,4-alpha-glucan branching protein domain-containing protein [Alicyclobacillus fastidiosus]WEH09411.1 DUF1957 domain-containing protein [Alicyclobacillus fastidiosus]